jgi:hypothetical protein
MTLFRKARETILSFNGLVSCINEKKEKAFVASRELVISVLALYFSNPPVA